MEESIKIILDELIKQTARAVLAEKQLETYRLAHTYVNSKNEELEKKVAELEAKLAEEGEKNDAV